MPRRGGGAGLEELAGKGEAVHGIGDVEGLGEGGGEGGWSRGGGEEEVDDGCVGGFDGAAEGRSLVGVDVGAGGEEGGEDCEVGAGRGGRGRLEKGLDFFEEDCVEHVFLGSAAEEGVDFGEFGGVRGELREGVEATIEGVGVGIAVLEDELEDCRVWVGDGWAVLVNMMTSGLSPLTEGNGQALVKVGIRPSLFHEQRNQLDIHRLDGK